VLKNPPISEAILAELQVIKQVGHSKFPVFQLQSKTSNQYYAIKTFPYVDSKASPFFLNEFKFKDLKHPNIVTIIGAFQEDIIFKGLPKEQKNSHILMEYAPYGDFADIVINSQFPADEKLARTYFHQIVEAVDYIHKSGYAHLDLKLDNLLISKDFSLKLADFDGSVTLDANEHLGRGTANYRAPEMIF